MPRYADKPKSCAGCPAEKIGLSYVPGRGPKDTVIAFVGQGPGRVEAHQGRPFVGPSGERLHQWMEEAGFSAIQLVPHTIYKDNVVRCWLPKNREPTRAERDFCTRVHVDPDLESMPNLKFIVAVGTSAMRHFFGERAGERTAGTIRRWVPKRDGPQQGGQGTSDGPILEPVDGPRRVEESDRQETD